MIDLKINIDQLKNYLGTGLKCEHPRTKGHYWKLSHDDTILNTISIKVALEIGAKPICFRLSDLDKFIPELGFVPIEKIGKSRSIDWSLPEKREKATKLFIQDMKIFRISFDMVQKLFQWNFWPFEQEYFTEGLVIDKLKHGKEESNE